jgi:hypothetical protein
LAEIDLGSCAGRQRGGDGHAQSKSEESLDARAWWDKPMQQRLQAQMNIALMRGAFRALNFFRFFGTKLLLNKICTSCAE